MENKNIKIKICTPYKEYVYGGDYQFKTLINTIRFNSPTWFEFVDDKGFNQAVHTNEIVSIEEFE